MKNNKPLISIITVTYNAEKYIENTIKSILEQDLDRNKFEFIIIDGCSTDNTLNIIKKYEDAIDKIISEKDKGIYDAMNKGIYYANGNWINFLNAGDTFYSSDTLSKLTLEKRINLDLLYGNHIIKNEFTGKEDLIFSLEFSKENLIKYTTRVACHQSMIIKRDKIPFYDLSFKLKSELDLYFYMYYNKFRYEKLDFPISIFLEGGLGTQMILLNSIERIKVILKWSSFFSNYKSIARILIDIIKIKLRKNQL